MVEGKQSRIRGIERDDAPALQCLYRAEYPRAALLDNRMESLFPTRDELRELLSSAEGKRGQLYAVEFLDGRIAGFCSLRTAPVEASFAEVGLLLFEDSFYGSELAVEAMGFIKERAFRKMGLNKIFAQCLDNETALRECLLHHGFTSDGARREAFFGRGVYHDVEAFSLFARDCAPGGTA